ncbi:MULTISPECIES: phenylacetate--CoA ligase family protein [unclassified Pseudoalteromonas]|uniref:phenylacetate--CoA ligase family protein n=1 Tax=unclassified Pseudoalteromonas TaxID=194690 RepID=UPI000428A1FF|nr:MULTISPECIES: phenylacetate--CoA ligase family protein [unclassified Pseudoalteromonas]
MLNSKIYKMTPIFIQNCILTIRGFIRVKLKKNTFSEETLCIIHENERSADKLQSYSGAMLKSCIDNALNNVDFYKEHLSSEKCINSFPIIDKSVVRSNPSAFISDVKPKVVISGATSGTTGSPLTIYQDLMAVNREQAFFDRQREWAGYKKGDKRAWIRGDMVVPFTQKKAPFWRYSYFEDMILLSSFHISANTIPGYINAMFDFGVDIIQAYPSSITALARYLELVDSYYPGKIKSILTSSESLSDEDRLLIETRFQCKVFDWYGLFERVAAIGQCENGSYHLLTDYSHVELIPVDESGRHEIVGTNFNNHYFPLIRYRTGDHVYLSDEESCPCGRVFPIIEKIEGRIGDFLIGEDGQKIHILNHIPKGVVGLLGCQFHQESLGTVHVLVMVDEMIFGENERIILIENTKERLGQTIDVTIEVVKSIQRTKSGKMRQAICNIRDKSEEKN